jgi:hypothetical protein
VNDLLARIDEFRHAGPKVIGNRKWILSGDRVLLRDRRDWRDWVGPGVLILLFSTGAAYCIPADFFDAPPMLVALQLLGIVLFISWMSGLWTLVPHVLALDWRQPAITQTEGYAVVVPFAEIECILGVLDPEGESSSLWGVRRNGRTFTLPYLSPVRSLRQNAAAYGFVLDKPALYLDDVQRLASFWRTGSIDLERLATARVERLSRYEWRDDAGEPSESGSAPQRAAHNDGTD